jgi:hypothetical protein
VTWVRCSATAWLTSHADPAEALRGANRSTRDSSSLPQKTPAVVQATVSIVLLAVAGLLTRSLQKMEHQDFGFQTDPRVNIILFQLLPGEAERDLSRFAGSLVTHSGGPARSSRALYPFHR